MKDKMSKSAERAKYIRESRRDRAWSQSQLAQIADVNLRTIQRVERDGSASFETLRGLAQAFDVDIKELSFDEQGAATRTKDATLNRKVHLMPQLLTGQGITKIVVGAEQFQFAHDDDQDPRSIAAMKDILRLLQSDVVRLYDADPIERLSVEAELSREIKGLEEYGYYLFGSAREVPKRDSGNMLRVKMCSIYMSHIRSPKIIRDKQLKLLMPTLLPEIAN